MGRHRGSVLLAKVGACLISIAAFLGIIATLPSASALTAQLIASGLSQPLYVTAPPGDTTHIYIVEQTGRIQVLDLQTNQLTTFFTVTGLTGTSGEQGLLGLAFDPDYATNSKFYVNFTVPGGAFGNGVTHVSQFDAQALTVPTKRKSDDGTSGNTRPAKEFCSNLIIRSLTITAGGSPLALVPATITICISPPAMVAAEMIRAPVTSNRAATPKAP